MKRGPTTKQIEAATLRKKGVSLRHSGKRMGISYEAVRLLLVRYDRNIKRG